MSKKLIIHETDCHGCGTVIYNGHIVSYTYDDGYLGDVASTVQALIDMGFINKDDVKIFNGDDFYKFVENKILEEVDWLPLLYLDVWRLNSWLTKQEGCDIILSESGVRTMLTIWRLECSYNDDVFYFSTKERAEEWLARRGECKNDWWFDEFDISDDN